MLIKSNSFSLIIILNQPANPQDSTEIFNKLKIVWILPDKPDIFGKYLKDNDDRLLISYNSRNVFWSSIKFPSLKKIIPFSLSSLKSAISFNYTNISEHPNLYEDSGSSQKLTEVSQKYSKFIEVCKI